jgi:hypothetical protein
VAVSCQWVWSRGYAVRRQPRLSVSAYSIVPVLATDARFSISPSWIINYNNKKESNTTSECIVIFIYNV